MKSFRLANFVKERVGQLYDVFDYANKHPYTTLRHQAHDDTVAFIKERCPKAIGLRTPRRLFDFVHKRVTLPGDIAEFGVSRGGSIRYIAKHFKNRTIHGFDSFEGIPEAWAGNDEGAFSTHGKFPKVPSNVKFWPGWFEDSIPKWREKYNDQLAYVHIDCDLYSSTKTIFDGIGDLMGSGTVILFDDYFNFPDWENDGHKVLEDAIKKHNWEIEYLAYAWKELAIKIK